MSSSSSLSSSSSSSSSSSLSSSSSSSSSIAPTAERVSASLPLVLALSLVSALATALGAAPFVFVSRLSSHWVCRSNALASGLMIAASVGLLAEGHAYSLSLTLGGAVLGVVVVQALEALLDVLKRFDVADNDGSAGAAAAGGPAQRSTRSTTSKSASPSPSPSSSLAASLSHSLLRVRRTVLLMVVMTAHSFAEGVGLGVAFGGGQSLGRRVAYALAVHNVPEGLAIACVAVPDGATVLDAALLAVGSSLPQPLLALPAYYAVESARPLLPAGLGLAGGAMLAMTFTELLPECIGARSGGGSGGCCTRRAGCASDDDDAAAAAAADADADADADARSSSRQRRASSKHTASAKKQQKNEKNETTTAKKKNEKKKKKTCTCGPSLSPAQRATNVGIVVVGALAMGAFMLASAEAEHGNESVKR